MEVCGGVGSKEHLPCGARPHCMPMEQRIQSRRRSNSPVCTLGAEPLIQCLPPDSPVWRSGWRNRTVPRGLQEHLPKRGGILHGYTMARPSSTAAFTGAAITTDLAMLCAPPSLCAAGAPAAAGSMCGALGSPPFASNAHLLPERGAGASDELGLQDPAPCAAVSIPRRSAGKGLSSAGSPILRTVPASLAYMAASALGG